jgi:hypothetical protein
LQPAAEQKTAFFALDEAQPQFNANGVLEVLNLCSYSVFINPLYVSFKKIVIFVRDHSILIILSVLEIGKFNMCFTAFILWSFL